MPGPQSSPPKSGRPSRPKRRFTVAQANSTLPLVKRIVRDIVKAHADVLRCQAELERLGGKANQIKAQHAKAHQEAQDRLASGVEQLEDLVDELTEVGCELKDYRAGLIDFTGRHQGRDVCLCWKLGEERVVFWHELAAVFAGRQPIASLRETE